MAGITSPSFVICSDNSDAFDSNIGINRAQPAKLLLYIHVMNAPSVRREPAPQAREAPAVASHILKLDKAVAECLDLPLDWALGRAQFSLLPEDSGPVSPPSTPCSKTSRDVQSPGEASERRRATCGIMPA